MDDTHLQRMLAEYRRRVGRAKAAPPPDDLVPGAEPVAKPAD